MNLYKHIVEQPFVMATGVAALVHSTWSLGTLFSGKQPEASLSVEFIGWIVPAFLIAFAMDVGQIATSAEIRAGNRSKAKYATFAVFAISTFYLQWLYMAHHMPHLELAGGVREQWSGFATFVRDAAVWIIPAFLPLSTLMYTFSSDHAQPELKIMPVPSDGIIHIELPKGVDELPAPEEDEVEMPADSPGVFPLPEFIRHLKTNVTTTETSDKEIVHCPSCGWSKKYPTSSAARRGLSTHMAQWCPSLNLDKSPVFTSTNGNGHGEDE